MGKTEPPHNSPAPYAFRRMTSVENSAQAGHSDAVAHGCGTFQPLFKSNGSDGRPADRQEQAAQSEQARCRGMQQGLASGRAEASRIARSGLSPSLKALIHALKDLAESNQQMKAQVSAKVIEMALSISERVLGESARLTAGAMGDLKALLEDALAQLNRITLHFNPTDAQGLEALLVAEGLGWPSHPQIDIESDALVLPGEARFATPDASRASLDRSVLSALTQLLSKPHPHTP